LGSQNFLVRPKVDDIDLVTTLPNAHQEVIWLDVTMYEVEKYKPGTAMAGLKQPSLAYQSKISSKIDLAQLNQQVRMWIPDKTPHQ